MSIKSPDIDWKLVILVVVLLISYIDSSDQSEIVTYCQGDNASFTWDYELRPFYVIEWYAKETQIGETSKPSFSQDVLHINDNYTRRFRLHNNTGVGFTITNVTEADEGDYKCLVTLRNTGTLKTLKKTLQVEECEGNNTMRSYKPVGSTMPTTSTPPEDGTTLAIVLGFFISCGVLALGVSAYIYWRCRRSRPGHFTEENATSPAIHDGSSENERRLIR